MKKIAILMMYLGTGGIEKQTISMANMLADDYDIEIISLYNFKYVSFDIDPRIKVRYLMNTGSNRKEFKNALKNKDIKNVLKEGFKSLYVLSVKDLKMINYIKHSDADILFSTRIEYAKMISKYNIKHIPSITQEHNYIDTPEYEKQVQESMHGIDTLVVMSKVASDTYKKWLKGTNVKVVTIPNMLNEVPVESSNMKNNSLIAAGRLVPVKNFMELIDVFNIVHDKDKTITLTIVGDGEERNKLQEHVNELKLYNNVNFTGMLAPDDVKKAMLYSDLYVMTSLRECFPMVLLEANSLGVPAISYDVKTGPVAIIKDSKTGYLIDNHNKEEMASKILNYMHNQSIKNMMSINAKEESRKYIPTKIKPLWIKILGKD